MLDERYIDLAGAIIKQAAADYAEAKLRLEADAGDIWAARTYSDVRRFISSRWGKSLCPVDKEEFYKFAEEIADSRRTGHYKWARNKKTFKIICVETGIEYNSWTEVRKNTKECYGAVMRSVRTGKPTRRGLHWVIKKEETE